MSFKQGRLGEKARLVNALNILSFELKTVQLKRGGWRGSAKQARSQTRDWKGRNGFRGMCKNVLSQSQLESLL